MRKKLAIIIIVLALLGAAGLGVWASTPLDEILSPTPAPTTTAISATAVTAVDIVSYSGYSACSFTVKPAVSGWQLHYSFTTPGTVGMLAERDSVLDVVTVTPAQFPLGRPPVALEANVSRKFTISVSGPGTWQYAVRPPEGAPVNEGFLNQPADTATSAAQQSFRLQACRG